MMRANVEEIEFREAWRAAQRRALNAWVASRLNPYGAEARSLPGLEEHLAEIEAQVEAMTNIR